MAALDWMLCDEAYGLSKYRVTVSTAGILPAMSQLKKDLPVSSKLELIQLDLLEQHVVLIILQQLMALMEQDN